MEGGLVTIRPNGASFLWSPKKLPIQAKQHQILDCCLGRNDMVRLLTKTTADSLRTAGMSFGLKVLVGFCFPPEKVDTEPNTSKT